jgi:hypothetical protein
MASWNCVFACDLFSFMVGVKRPFSTLNASSTSVTAVTCAVPYISLCQKRPSSTMRQDYILLASKRRLRSCQLILPWNCLTNLLKALQSGGPAFLKHAVQDSSHDTGI